MESTFEQHDTQFPPSGQKTLGKGIKKTKYDNITNIAHHNCLGGIVSMKLTH